MFVKTDTDLGERCEGCEDTEDLKLLETFDFDPGDTSDTGDPDTGHFLFHFSVYVPRCVTK